MGYQKALIGKFPLNNDCTQVVFDGTTKIFTHTFSSKTIHFTLENCIATSGRVETILSYSLDNYPILMYSLFREEKQMELSVDACFIS
jgi:hypothetical protein